MGVYAMEGQLNPLFQPEYHMLADLYFLALFAPLSPPPTSPPFVFRI